MNGQALTIALIALVVAGCRPATFSEKSPTGPADPSMPVAAETELPGPSTAPYPGLGWTYNGAPIGPSFISMIATPEHCARPGVITLTMGRPFGREIVTSDDAMQFARDPGHLLGGQIQVPFEPSVSLPPDAYFTGLRQGDLEVWSSDRQLDRAIYIVRAGGSVAELWPRVRELLACA